MRKLIGVVGQMGSGKSAVCTILRQNGATVIDADDVNRNLAFDVDYLNKIAEICPEAVEDRKIDYPTLRSWAFADPEHLQALEKVAQPMIRDRILDMTVGVPLAFVELSVYREGFLPLDEVWVVTADEQKRLSRVALRNPDWAFEDITRAFDAQRNMRFPHGAKVIFNNGGRRQLEEQVVKLYRETV